MKHTDKADIDGKTIHVRTKQNDSIKRIKTSVVIEELHPKIKVQTTNINVVPNISVKTTEVPLEIKVSDIASKGADINKEK